jgi:hypothetical protein
LAQATPAILKQLDPKNSTGDDRTGWRYEGFFFRADDEYAVPFLAVFNFMRGTYSRGGGQWARSEPAVGARPAPPCTRTNHWKGTHPTRPVP